MKKHVFMLLSIILYLGCKNPGKEQSTEQTDESISDLYELKRSMVRTDHFEYFDFIIGEEHAVLIESETFCEIRMKADSHSYFLFHIQPVLSDRKLEHLFGEYYAFPYWTGGNYSRAKGYNLVKINRDTAFFIGPYCGYADIDSNGTKEFYFNEVIEFGRSNADHKIGQFEAILRNDSLFYPGLMDYY